MSKVIANSPAARANLKVGDIIVEFAGHAINRSASLPPLVAARIANSATTMRIVRNGQTQTIKITVGLLADEPLAAADQPSAPLGLLVSDISREDRASIGLENGVRVERVESGKPAANAGLQPKDIIIAFDHSSIDNVAELANLSSRSRPGKTVSILVQRHGQTQFLALKIPDKQAG